MVEANPVVHHGDQYRGAPGGKRPGARQVDETVVPGLVRVQRIIGRRLRRRGGGTVHPVQGAGGLIQPDESIARHSGDGRVLAQRRRYCVQLRRVRNADPCREDRG